MKRMIYLLIVCSLLSFTKDTLSDDDFNVLTLDIVLAEEHAEGVAPGIYQVIEGERSLVTPLAFTKKEGNSALFANNLKKVYRAFNIMGIDDKDIRVAYVINDSDEHSETYRLLGVVKTAESSPYLNL